MMLPSRDLSLLGWALRYEQDTGEVSSMSFFVCVCKLVSNPKRQKQNQTNFFKFHRQILSYWDRLLPELQQMIQWMADWQHAHDRLKRGWHSIHLNFEPVTSVIAY